MSFVVFCKSLLQLCLKIKSNGPSRLYRLLLQEKQKLNEYVTLFYACKPKWIEHKMLLQCKDRIKKINNNYDNYGIPQVNWKEVDCYLHSSSAKDHRPQCTKSSCLFFNVPVIGYREKKQFCPRLLWVISPVHSCGSQKWRLGGGQWFYRAVSGTQSFVTKHCTQLAGSVWPNTLTMCTQL